MENGITIVSSSGLGVKGGGGGRWIVSGSFGYCIIYHYVNYMFASFNFSYFYSILLPPFASYNSTRPIKKRFFAASLAASQIIIDKPQTTVIISRKENVTYQSTSRLKTCDLLLE